MENDNKPSEEAPGSDIEHTRKFLKKMVAIASQPEIIAEEASRVIKGYQDTVRRFVPGFVENVKAVSKAMIAEDGRVMQLDPVTKKPKLLNATLFKLAETEIPKESMPRLRDGGAIIFWFGDNTIAGNSTLFNNRLAEWNRILAKSFVKQLMPDFTSAHTVMASEPQQGFWPHPIALIIMCEPDDRQKLYDQIFPAAEAVIAEHNQRGGGRGR
jgi:hypothetical protein